MTWGRAALVALLVCLTAGCLSGGSPSDSDSPRGRVEALKRALVEADGRALVRLVDDPSFDVSVALLTDTVLAHGALASQDVEVDKTKNGLETIRYALGIPGDDGRPWLEPEARLSGELVGSALPSVTIHGPGVTSVTVDGETVEIDPLPSEGQAFYLPPGEYEIGVGGGGHYVDHSPAQGYDTRKVSVDDLEFTGQLTAAGSSRVQERVDAFVRGCTKAVRGDRPVSCPASKAFVGGLDSSQWTLEADPRTVITASGKGWLLSTPDPPMARMRGVVRDRDSGASEQVTDAVRFVVSGKVSVRDDSLVVAIPGY